MAIPSTGAEQLENFMESEITHRRMTNSCIIKYTDSNQSINIPYESWAMKYYDFFEDYILEIDIPEEMWETYKNAPKMVSQDVYNTTEYWQFILFLNDCHSVLDFTEVSTIKLIDPAKINEIIEEIIALEEKEE